MSSAAGGHRSAAAEWEAERYAARRMRAALLPFGRSPGALLGVVLAVLTVVLGSGIAAVRPSTSASTPADGSAWLLPDGRILFIEDGVAYPMLNPVSALLLAGEIDRTNEPDLSGLQVGSPRGIAGALSTLPARAGLLSADWQLCSYGPAEHTLTFGAAPYLPPPAADAVALSDGAQTWLVIDGQRYPSELAQPAAVTTSGTVIELLPAGEAPAPAAQVAAHPSAVVCVQSDPAARLARPSAAALGRDPAGTGVRNAGARVLLPHGSGVLAHRHDGGYWLLTYTGELAPVADDAALRQLGYQPADAVHLPHELVELLHAGPLLSIEAAGSIVQTHSGQ